LYFAPLQHSVWLSPIYVSHVLNGGDEYDKDSIATERAFIVIYQHAFVIASHEVDSLSAVALGMPAQQWAPALHA